MYCYLYILLRVILKFNKIEVSSMMNFLLLWADTFLFSLLFRRKFFWHNLSPLQLFTHLISFYLSLISPFPPFTLLLPMPKIHCVDLTEVWHTAILLIQFPICWNYKVKWYCHPKMLGYLSFKLISLIQLSIYRFSFTMCVQIHAVSCIRKKIIRMFFSHIIHSGL